MFLCFHILIYRETCMLLCFHVLIYRETCMFHVLTFSPKMMYACNGKWSIGQGGGYCHTLASEDYIQGKLWSIILPLRVDLHVT